MKEEMIVKIKKMYPDSTIPEKQTEFSAGVDLHAYCKEKEITIQKGKVELIPTGLAFEIPVGFDIEIRPRSGLSTKHRVIMPNSPGTIDCDYRGEILVPMFNLGDSEFVVTHNMRIAQAILRKTFDFSWKISVELDESSKRGSGGFGSTGF